jgi:predicted  nucleic acid-binding Zn-ribbon protein
MSEVEQFDPRKHHRESYDLGCEHNWVALRDAERKAEYQREAYDDEVARSKRFGDQLIKLTTEFRKYQQAYIDAETEIGELKRQLKAFDEQREVEE